MHGKKNMRLSCEFIRFENGRLNYECKEYAKSYTNVTNESIRNFQIDFNLKILIQRIKFRKYHR